MKKPTNKRLASSKSHSNFSECVTTDRKIANPTVIYNTSTIDSDAVRDAQNLSLLRQNLYSGIDCYNKVVRALERKYGNGFKKLVREASS